MRSRYIFTRSLPFLIVIISIFISVNISSGNTPPRFPNDTFCVTVNEIPQTECDALAALYNNTEGSNWANNDGWLNTSSPCSWKGVACNIAGHVTDLNLANNSLKGTIPSEIGNLQELRLLLLHDNQLGGTIPTTLGNLGNLQALSLFNNNLTGSIPNQIGNLAKLQEINLQNNQLSGNIPSQLGNLASLRLLILGGNQLTGGLASELANLANLETLYLWGNPLGGNIPSQYGNLSNLVELDLNNTQLSGNIPPQLGNLTKLHNLTLSYNQLTGMIPKELGQLVALRQLQLNQNLISGNIPVELGNLANLKNLDLELNRLDGSIPKELGRLTKLQYLYLDRNMLSGSIPLEIGELSDLRGIYLYHNELIGAIPNTLANIATLFEIDFSENHLTGSIPKEFGSLNNLQFLKLYQNRLDGYVPGELSQLPLLRGLLLSENQLAGAIPVQFANLCDTLEYLTLEYNALSISDQSSIACLTQKNPEWVNTQTVPVTSLEAIALSSDKVQLSWTPISYRNDGGYYEMGYAKSLEGPYIVIDDKSITKDKTAYVVNNLLSKTTYFFRMRTYTPAHSAQQNDIWSSFSDIASVTTILNPEVSIDVAISGPTSGVVNKSYSFISTVSPITATLPITYSWQATDQAPVVHTSMSRNDTITFTWNNSGTKTVSVVANDIHGMVTDTHTMDIDATAIPTLTWGIMIYLNGDNNLDPYTFPVFNRLESVANNPNVRICVLWDRKDTSDTLRYIAQHNTKPFELAAYTPNVNVWEMGELNMGDPQTLYEFMVWSAQQCSAKHYLLAIIDHGGGWSPKLPSQPRRYASTGMSFDDTDGQSFLSTQDMELVFKNFMSKTSHKLDVVFYDACLMATIEDSYAIKDYANYLVASENESWAAFPYDKYLSGTTSETQPRDMAISLVEVYDHQLLGYPRTIGAFDLGGMNRISATVNTLAEALIGSLEHESSSIHSSISSSQKLDCNWDMALNADDYCVDLYHLASLLDQNVADNNVKSAAQAVIDAIGEVDGDFLVRSRNRSGFTPDGAYWNLGNAHGLSIYMPFEKIHLFHEYYNESQFAFVRDTQWQHFINSYCEQYCPPLGATPDPIAPELRPGPLTIPNVIYLPVITR